MAEDSDSLEEDINLTTSFSGSTIKYEEDSDPTTENEHFSGLAVATRSSSQWILDSRSSRSISANLGIFKDYCDWKPDEKPYYYGSSVGLSGTTLGWGHTKLTFNTGFEIRFKCYYNPATPLSMLSVNQLHKSLAIGWDSAIHTLYTIKDQKPVGYTCSEHGVSMLQLQYDRPVESYQLAAVPISENLLHH